MSSDNCDQNKTETPEACPHVMHAIPLPVFEDLRAEADKMGLTTPFWITFRLSWTLNKTAIHVAENPSMN